MRIKSYRSNYLSGWLVPGVLFLTLASFHKGTADTVTVAKTGDAVDGGGTLLRFWTTAGSSATTPVLNHQDEIVFFAKLTDTPPDADAGLFAWNKGTLTPLIRKGGLTPDGSETHLTIGQPGYNKSGDVVFIGNETAPGLQFGQYTVYRLSALNRTELVHGLDPLPQIANSAFGQFNFAFVEPPTPNASGDFAVFANCFPSATQLPGLFRIDGTTVRTVAISLLSDSVQVGQTMFTGDWRLVEAPAHTPMNDAGTIAFVGRVQSPSTFEVRNGIWINRKDSPQPNAAVVLVGDSLPDGSGKFSNLNLADYNLNSSGEFSFNATLTGTSQGAVNNAGLYRARLGEVTEILRKGQSAPGGNGKITASTYVESKINEAGQVAFVTVLTGTSGGTSDDAVILRGSGGPLTTIARENQLAPNASGALVGRFDSFPSAISFNDAGQVAWATPAALRGSGLFSVFGIFTGDGIDLISVARTGDPCEGSTYRRFDSGFGARGLNNLGQVVFNAELEDGRRAIRLWTPDLRWRTQGNGSWEVATNWTLSLAPAAVHNVFIAPSNTVTVLGPAGNTQVKALYIGGGTVNASLTLQAGSSIAATDGTTIAPNGSVLGNGQLLGSVTNYGVISPGSSPGSLVIQGDWNQTATSSFLAEIGGLSPSQYDRLQVNGNLNLAGNLQVNLLNGHALNTGESYVIAAVSGTRTGTFNGLSEGARIGTFGGTDLFITYAGGDGNDVALFTQGPGQPNPSVIYLPGGPTVNVLFYGVPGQQYLLQRSVDLQTWITLQTLLAAPDGKLSYTDPNPPANGAFYRVTSP
jgi:hypothetical protein